MLVFLGPESLLVFEPATRVGELISGGAPPGALIGQAIPVTIFTTVAAAALISRLYASSWVEAAAILLTCTILVGPLGLNISLMGLVSIPVSSLYLLAEMFGLILALYLVFVCGFLILEWRGLTNHLRSGSNGDAR